VHPCVEINAVIDLAAALADEGQFHAIEEPQTTADVSGGFTAGEIANRRGREWSFSDAAGKLWTRQL
jgi:hypothetical protein